MDLSDWDSLSPETQQKVRAAVDRMQSSHGHKRVRDSDEVSFASPKSNILLQPDTYIGHGHQRVHDSFAPPAQIKKSPILLDSDSFASPQASEFATFTTPRRQKTRHNAFSAPASEGRGRERERPLTSTERVKLHRLRNAKYASAKSKRDYLSNKKKTTVLSEEEEQKLARCQAVCNEWKKNSGRIQGSNADKRGLLAASEELQRQQRAQDRRTIAASEELQRRQSISDRASLAGNAQTNAKEIHSTGWANARSVTETCVSNIRGAVGEALAYGRASDMQHIQLQKDVALQGNLHGGSDGLEDRKPAAVDLDDRKPAAVDLDDGKPRAVQLDDDAGRNPTTLQLDDGKPRAVQLDDDADRNPAFVQLEGPEPVATDILKENSSLRERVDSLERQLVDRVSFLRTQLKASEKELVKYSARNDFLENQVKTLLREKNGILREKNDMSGQIEEIATDLEETEADRVIYVQRAEKFAAILRQHGIPFDD